MQTLSWYLKRLRAMSAGEIARRTWAAVRAPVERRTVGRRARQAARRAARMVQGPQDPATNGAAIVPPGAGERLPAAWRERLIRRANRLALGHLPVFDFEADFTAGRVDWNCDAKHRIRGPLTYGPAIDYRDFRVAGDAKIVWEPSRHQHLVVLGRAYRATGDVAFARAAAEHLLSWLDQCPYGYGPQWRSPLEFGVRLINWVWALELIRPAGVLSPADTRRIIQSVLLHVQEITRHYSFGSSANNHLVGEAAGVYLASRYFVGMPGAAAHAARSRDILARELLAQTHPDGGTQEQAISYHLFALQFFTLVALVGRRSGDAFPQEYWERLRSAYDFLAALAEGGEHLPMFGDADDGFVLDLDGDALDARPWLAVGAALFGAGRLHAVSGGQTEAVQWLLGAEGERAYQAAGNGWPAAQPLTSAAFRDTGYYLLQSGSAGGTDALSVVFDCAPLGYGPLAAHGHADALSFTLRAGGADVLVDPGTYDYFTYPKYREYFRSTRAHNTILVDGVDQSVMLGSFLWGARATARVIAWEPTSDGGRIVGEHDGYQRLADPVTHRRELQLSAARGELIVIDELAATGRHDYALHFHLAEQCRLIACGENRIEIDAGAARVILEFDARLVIALLRGDEDAPAGWVSRGYHRKTACTTVVGRCAADGAVTLRTRITVRPVERNGDHAEDTQEGAVSAYRSERSGVEVA